MANRRQNIDASKENCYYGNIYQMEKNRMDCEGFKNWLKTEYTYTEATVKDMASRLRRANNMLEFFNDDVYLFRLSQTEDFNNVSPAVKSQIRKAVKLYTTYINEMEKK